MKPITKTKHALFGLVPGLLFMAASLASILISTTARADISFTITENTAANTITVTGFSAGFDPDVGFDSKDEDVVSYQGQLFHDQISRSAIIDLSPPPAEPLPLVDRLFFTDVPPDTSWFTGFGGVLPISHSGDRFGFSYYVRQKIIVPADYAGGPLSGSCDFPGSFASLQLIPGVYSWPAAGAGTITVTVGPEPDTDGDGLTDDEEADLALSSGVPNCPDPNNPDSDGDGLTDGAEVGYGTVSGIGTDPCVADSDGDGFDDGVEVALGSDPLSSESDPADVIEADLVNLADSILLIDLSSVIPPNGKANTPAGRRNALSNKVRAAARMAAAGNLSGARSKLSGDVIASTNDWIEDPALTDLIDEINTLLALIDAALGG